MQPQRRRDAEEAAEGKAGQVRVDEFLARNGPSEERDPLTERIIAAALEVHRELGPGMTEAMYEEALALEFDLREILYTRQVPVIVRYKGKPVGKTRLDFVVEEKVVVELKACDSLNAVHRAQCICYLRATRLGLALLINFNVPILKDGIKRVILSS